MMAELLNALMTAFFLMVVIGLAVLLIIQYFSR
jgi:hypothetical protein